MYLEKKPKEVQIGIFNGHQDLYNPKVVLLDMLAEMADQHSTVVIGIEEILFHHCLRFKGTGTWYWVRVKSTSSGNSIRASKMNM